MRENACWTDGKTQKSYNCGFGQSSNGNLIFAGTRLYHSGSPVVLRDDVRDDLELLDLLEKGSSKFIFFSTCEERVIQFNKPVYAYELKTNLPATYVGKRGGFDAANDFFSTLENIAYFSDKECEVVIRSTFIDAYLKKPTSLMSSLCYYLTCCCR